MFCDEATIFVKAGSGGNGMVSMRREKYIPKGGPDGGDGGRGGNIILIADHNQNTLANYKATYRFIADNGTHGSEKNKHGKNGECLKLKLPVGTIIKDKETGETLVDLDENEKEVVLLRGGRGGFGNAHFKSSIHKTPRFAEKGEPGQEQEVTLELKLVADVALVGFPSVGKSTLISVISNSKPKIAEYHFTTLIPNLGVVNIDDDSFVCADVPGLIEGASDGKGLGDQFLRHIERCKAVVHILDCTRENIADDYKKIRKELEKYSKKMIEKKEVIVINKIDTIDEELCELLIKDLKENINKKREKIFLISAVSSKNLTPLLRKISTILKKTKKVEVEELSETEDYKVYRPHLNLPKDEWTVEKDGDIYRLSGPRIEQLVIMTNWDLYEARYHLRDVFMKKKIEHALRREGFEDGDTLFVGEYNITELYI